MEAAPHGAADAGGIVLSITSGSDFSEANGTERVVAGYRFRPEQHERASVRWFGIRVGWHADRAGLRTSVRKACNTMRFCRRMESSSLSSRNRRLIAAVYKVHSLEDARSRWTLCEGGQGFDNLKVVEIILNLRALVG